MADVEQVEQIDEDALFESAVSDEATDSPAVTEKAEQTENQDATATLEAEPGKTETTDQKPPIPPKPEWRMREDAEARRAAEAELANERAEKAALRQRLEALEKPAAKVEQTRAAKPDPLLDPEGYEKYLDEKFEAKRLNDRRDIDLALTRQTNPEAFNNAHNEAMRLKAAGDPAFLELSQKMQTDSPGSVLLKWHQERTMRAEVGTDLAAYKQKLRDEALKDPEFRKAAMEAWRNEGNPQQQNGRPRVDIPPSLNGASRSNASLRASMDADVDDDSLFEQTTA